MSGRMTPFQRRADKILRKHGWEFEKFTAKSYTLYRHPATGKTTPPVSNSPKNEHDALRQVMKVAGIKR